MLTLESSFLDAKWALELQNNGIPENKEIIPFAYWEIKENGTDFLTGKPSFSASFVIPELSRLECKTLNCGKHRKIPTYTLEQLQSLIAHRGMSENDEYRQLVKGFGSDLKVNAAMKLLFMKRNGFYP